MNVEQEIKVLKDQVAKLKKQMKAANQRLHYIDTTFIRDNTPDWSKFEFVFDDEDNGSFDKDEQ